MNNPLVAELVLQEMDRRKQEVREARQRSGRPERRWRRARRAAEPRTR